MSQRDDVHSVLRLNFETPRGLISLASPSVAKPTGCETEAVVSVTLECQDPFYAGCRLMNINKPTMGEGAARFWSAVFGGITAVGLIAAGIYTLVQYFDAKRTERESHDKDRATLQLQIAATSLAAKQAFNSKHLELCAQATGDAGTIASSKDKSKHRLAEDDFWRLYLGPLRIVEDLEVARAMHAFGDCLDDLEGKNDLRYRVACDGAPLSQLATALARACRSEVSKDFQLDLPSVPTGPVLPARPVPTH